MVQAARDSQLKLRYPILKLDQCGYRCSDYRGNGHRDWRDQTTVDPDIDSAIVPTGSVQLDLMSTGRPTTPGECPSPAMHRARQGIRAKRDAL